ncbi:MAG TPA: type II CAAX endopeptidase family protein [Verrucomicrobiae bacterium]|nr:type II CAAX endopeptidase family protein [Verrucomicrobiae bacterium]
MLSAKPWRWEMVIWFGVAQLVSLCLGLTLIGLLQKAGFAAFQTPGEPGAIVIGTLAFQGMTWVLIFIFLRLHQVNWRDAFGWHRAEFNRAWSPLVPVVIIFLPPAVLLVQYVSILTLTKMGWAPQTETAVLVLTGAKTWWLRIYLGVFTVIVAPVAEEFIFRGMLYPFVKQLGRPRLAWFGVSFLFALIHWDAAAFVALFLLALVLTWLYEKTDHLLAPIIAHAFFNAVNLILLCLFQNEMKPGPT